MESLQGNPSSDRDDRQQKIHDAKKFIAEHPELAENPKVAALQENGFMDIEGNPISEPLKLMESFLATLQLENSKTQMDDPVREKLINEAMVEHSKPGE